jgi:phosphate transport system substrate-binding protein
MRRTSIIALALIGLCLITTGCNRKSKLGGAGATFPALLYEQWANDFSNAKNVQITYTGVGSGTGEQNLVDGVVDFAGSDAPDVKTLDEKLGSSKGVVYVPMTAGSIVITYNLPGVEKLQLTQKAVAGIFLGKITRWNDDAIKESNKGVDLPDKDITVVVREDSSGTSYIFSGFLNKIAPNYGWEIEVSKSPNFPKSAIKSKGNPGVMGTVDQRQGAIGYVEYGYAKNAKKPMAWLENTKAGNFIEPTTKSGQAALAHIKLGDNNVGFTFNPEGDDSYPIATYTWMLFYKKYDTKQKADLIKEFANYGLGEGQKSAEGLGYIPLPEEVVSKVKKSLDQIGH